MKNIFLAVLLFTLFFTAGLTGIPKTLCDTVKIEIREDEQKTCAKDEVTIVTKPDLPYHSGFNVRISPMSRINTFVVIDGEEIVGERKVTRGHLRSQYEDFPYDLVYSFTEKNHFVEISTGGYSLSNILDRLEIKQ